MNTVNLSKLKKIEFDVTKKLFKYIYTNINLNKVIEELDKEYSYFYNTENNVAFNIWLSLDYINKDGKTFTEKFLEDKSESLSSKERKILEERKVSYVSLFKILEYDGEYTYVEDLLTRKRFSLLEPDLSNIIKEGEYVFSRIGLSLNNYNFIGDINYLPPSSKYDFIKGVLFDFNLVRETYRRLTMKDYLKRFGLNLYKIYDETILDAMGNEDGLDFHRIDDLESLSEFENYLSVKMDEDEVDIHITNLSDIIDFYFSSEYDDLKDFLSISLDEILSTSIDNGLIILKEDLLSYIDTFKLYFYFLSKKNSSYQNLYKEILDIGKSPFKYIRLLNSYDVDFNINKDLSYHIEDSLNYKALDFIKDFHNFLLYIESNDIRLTKKGKKLKRKDLFMINDSLKNKTRPFTKTPNQKHFINIDLFYNIALNLKLLSIDGHTMVFNKIATSFSLLEEYEKYTIIFESILDDNLINDSNNYRSFILSTLSNMDISKKYSNKLFVKDDHNLFFSYGNLLNLLGIINYDKYEIESISISPLGKRISRYLDTNKNPNKNKVINLIDLKK